MPYIIVLFSSVRTIKKITAFDRTLFSKKNQFCILPNRHTIGSKVVAKPFGAFFYEYDFFLAVHIAQF